MQDRIRRSPDNNGDGTELVTLDGTASSDSDGSIVSYEWSEGGTSIGVGATAAVWLSVGVHSLTLEVTDDDGDSATDTVVVTVDPPPTVGSFTLSASPGSMTCHAGIEWYQHDHDHAPGRLHRKRDAVCLGSTRAA